MTTNIIDFDFNNEEALDTVHIDLMTAKLADSGLTLSDASLLFMNALSSAETMSLSSTFAAAAAVQLNYIKPTGDPCLDKEGNPFYRLRYLAPVKGKTKDQRYTQKPATGTAAYYPTNIEWLTVVEDTSKPIIITEGEFKAAKACKEGFHTIGLGGVDCYKQADGSLIESLQEVTWSGRVVYICFDSDFRTNKGVAAAIKGITKAMNIVGAKVRVVALPQGLGNAKVGLDDYLVAEGRLAKESLQALLNSSATDGDESRTYTRKECMDYFNDNYVHLCGKDGKIINFRTGVAMSLHVFEKEHECFSYLETYTDSQGKERRKVKYAAAEWRGMGATKSAAIVGTKYMPGEPVKAEILGNPDPITGDRSFEKVLNVWKPYPVKPVKGDIAPFLELLDFIFNGKDDANKKWLTQWLAYPLQYPGTKLLSAVIICSTTHGNGKSTLGFTMSKIYGSNYTILSNKQLVGAFNDSSENKQFVHSDEVSSGDKRKDVDMLKDLITNPYMTLNKKGVGEYTVDNYINYFFTTNHLDGVYIEDKDRRYFVQEIESEVIPHFISTGGSYYKWLEDNGASALLYYLLNEVDTSDFNPKAPAPYTKSKEDMIRAGKGTAGAFVSMIKDTPEDINGLDRNGNMVRELYTAAELVELMKLEANDPHLNISVVGLGKLLGNVGIKTVNEGRVVSVDYGKYRYYAIFNRNEWKARSHAEIVAHIKLFSGIVGNVVGI